MTWASAPTATGAYTITMTVSTANDANSPPVEYYFECTPDGDFNSVWQSSPTYLASGLTPSTQYTFRAKARDSAPTLNETGWSTSLSATTQPPPTISPTTLLIISPTASPTTVETRGNEQSLFIVMGIVVIGLGVVGYLVLKRSRKQV